ncbi:MAG: hypothetical protein ACI8S6_001923 [Myxococcota bacterium]|jgi:hypothetical protein
MTALIDGVTLSGMHGQMLAPARTLQVLLRPQRMPLEFAFQAHSPRLSAADGRAPPLLLIAPPGRRVSRALLRHLREPGPDEEAFCSGRPVLGWLLADGLKRIFATAQRLPPRTIRRGLAALAAGAGVRLPPLDILTGREGATLLRTVRSIRALHRLRKPARVFLRTAGRWPVLCLAPSEAPEGWLGAVASRQGGRLLVDVAASPEQAESVCAALSALSSLCGLPPVVVRWASGGRLHRLPAAGTEAIIQRAYDSLGSGFRVSGEESEAIRAAGASPTYGELLLGGLARIFALLDAEGGAFLDLGSGTGRGVLSAAVGFPLARVHGVELSASRSALARAALANLRAQTGRLWPQLSLREGDMLREDVSGYDIIFISNLCFDVDFNRRLGEKLDRELVGTVHVLSSKQVTGARSTTLPKIEGVAMSWSRGSSLFHAVW